MHLQYTSTHRSPKVCPKNGHPPPLRKMEPIRTNSALLKSVRNNLIIALEMVDRSRRETPQEREATLWIAEGDLIDAQKALRQFLKLRGR